MKSYTLEMADGSGLSESFFSTDKDAVAWAVSVLEHRGCDAAELVSGDWETRNPDSVRKLFWANERTAQDDTGANAIAHLVKFASADDSSNYKVVTNAQNTGLDCEVFATKAEAENAIELCKQFVFSDYNFDVLPTNDAVTTTLEEWSKKDWE